MTIEKIFAEVFAIPESAIEDSLRFTDIASWDSMTHMQLILSLEQSFNTQFTGDEIADMKSVRDARTLLRTRGIAA